MDKIDRMAGAEQLLERAALERIVNRRVASPSPAAPGPRRCGDCGAPIAAARLRALPSADLCIACQREIEGGA